MLEKLENGFDEFMQMFCETEPERVLQELGELGITFSDYKETDIFTLNSITGYSTGIAGDINNLLLCA